MGNKQKMKSRSAVRGAALRRIFYVAYRIVYVALVVAGATRQYNADVSTYKSRLATYQQNTEKYQQDVATYNKDVAEYQAKLPGYTTAVEAEVKDIQDRINSNAPGNWDRYVEGRFLLYRGK
jgi:uncharacterized protein YlxW (UPF0749 family)